MMSRKGEGCVPRPIPLGSHRELMDEASAASGKAGKNALACPAGSSPHSRHDGCRAVSEMLRVSVKIRSRFDRNTGSSTCGAVSASRSACGSA